MHHRVRLLVLLDLDRPQALDPLLAVRVARVDLGHAQGEQRQREELEHVLGRRPVCHRRQKRFGLCGGFGILGGLESAESTFHYEKQPVSPWQFDEEILSVIKYP